MHLTNLIYMNKKGAVALKQPPLTVRLSCNYTWNPGGFFVRGVLQAMGQTGCVCCLGSRADYPPFAQNSLRWLLNQYDLTMPAPLKQALGGGS